MTNVTIDSHTLAAHLTPTRVPMTEMPDPVRILEQAQDAPGIPALNIFPIEWRVRTPKLYEIYDSARDPGWAPNKLPWNTLDVAGFTQDQRYAIAYWFTLLSVFDASGPAVFARAMIHTYETHEEDPIRKCFFSVVRDEMNHEEVCGRAIQAVTPGGPLDYEPQSDWGRLARNNIQWLYHNGARYWNGYKNAIHKYPVPILFTSFLFGEVASSTLFHGMFQRTTIPVFKEAFRRIGQDEGRHLGICLAVLQNVLPNLSEEDKSVITVQLRAGFVFLSGILFEPPEQFWELPQTFLPAHRGLEKLAQSAGLGILSHEERRENWRNSVLRMKANLEPYGVKFPALPEIGIDGETVAFDPDKIVPIF
jgi:rubrerythrin